MKSFQDKFIDAFSKALSDGDERLINEYINIMCDITVKVWNLRDEGENSAYPLEQLQNNCKILLNVCVDSNKEISKILFLKLINEIYKTLIKLINNEEILRLKNLNNSSSNNNKKRRQYFKILDWLNIYNFFMKIFSEIDIKTLRDTINISNLQVNMQLTDLVLFIESLAPEENIEQWKPDYSILDIQRFMGWYLHKQINTITILSDYYNDDYKIFAKECILNIYNLVDVKYKYDDSVKRVLTEIFSIENAIYFCGLINEGLTDIAGEIFSEYLNTENINHFDSNYIIIARVAPFCFIYYLGFCEIDKNVKPEICRKTKELAKKLAAQYKELLQKSGVINFMIHELINSCQYLEKIMRVFNSNTSEIVKNFCVFSIITSNISCISQLKNSDLESIKNFLESIQDDDDMTKNFPAFLDFISESSEKNFTNEIENFIKIINFILL